MRRGFVGHTRATGLTSVQKMTGIRSRTNRRVRSTNVRLSSVANFVMSEGNNTKCETGSIEEHRRSHTSPVLTFPMIRRTYKLAHQRNARIRKKNNQVRNVPRPTRSSVSNRVTLNATPHVGEITLLKTTAQFASIRRQFSLPRMSPRGTSTRRIFHTHAHTSRPSDAARATCEGM